MKSRAGERDTRAGRPPRPPAGGPLWAALIVVAALVAGRVDGDPHQGRGVAIFIDDASGAATVRSSQDLQTVLSPRVLPRVRSIVVTNSLRLDPLAFVPPLTLDKDLSICGGTEGVVVSGAAHFEMMAVAAGLTFCNLTFSLPFEAKVIYPHELLVDLRPGGSVNFEGVEFRLHPQTKGRLRNKVGHRGQWSPTFGSGCEFTKRAAFDSTVLSRVRLCEESAPALAGLHAVDVGPDGRELLGLSNASSRGDEPLVFRLGGNQTVGVCMLEDGRPYEVARPVTFQGAGGVGDAWIDFDPDLNAGGFMSVASGQVRVVGMNVGGWASDPAAGGAGCSPGNCPVRPEIIVRDSSASNGVFKFDDEAPGCRLVMKDAVAVQSCEYITKMYALAQSHKKLASNPRKGIQSPVEVIEAQWVGDRQRTLKFDKFMLNGECYQNVTVTCEPTIVEDASPTPCKDAPTDVQVPPRPLPPLPLLTPPPVSAALPNGSRPAESSGTLAAAPPARKGVTVNWTAVVLSVVLGVAAVTLVVLFVVRKSLIASLTCKDQPEDELKDVSVDARDWAKKPRSKESSEKRREWSEGGEGFLSAWEGGKGPAVRAGEKEKRTPKVNMEDSMTQASMIGAISNIQAGIEDNAVNIEEQIATGGYGVVYRGTWKGVSVAIKTVIFQDFADESNKQRQRAIFEAAISSSVSHRNIVQTYAYSFKRLEASGLEDSKHPLSMNSKMSISPSVGIVDWKLYIVQEFCNAGSVRQCLDNKLFLEADTGRADLQVVVQIALDSAKGMAHLHRHNIVHGDLSTKNILLKKDGNDGSGAHGTAKIADFGLSIKMDHMQSHVSNRRAGTPFYMAPELAQSGMLSKRADVFSFGVFLWELYHSKKCYQPNPVSGMQYHPLFPKFPIVCPMPYAMLCVACISPNPEDRPDFFFIVRVFVALMEKIAEGQYNALEDVRKMNMKLTAGLGKITGTRILEMIADQVGIPVHVDQPPGSLATSSESMLRMQHVGRDASRNEDTRSSQRFFTSASQADLASQQRSGSSWATPQSGDEEEPGIRLNQAFVTPFNCVVTVDNENTDVVSFSWEKSGDGHPGSGSVAAASRADRGSLSAASTSNRGQHARPAGSRSHSRRTPNASFAKPASSGRSAGSARSARSHQGGRGDESDRARGLGEPSSMDSPVSPGVNRALGVGAGLRVGGRDSEDGHASARRCMSPYSSQRPVNSVGGQSSSRGADNHQQRGHPSPQSRDRQLSGRGYSSPHRNHQSPHRSPRSRDSQHRSPRINLEVKFRHSVEDQPEVQWDDTPQQLSRSRSPVAVENRGPRPHGAGGRGAGRRRRDNSQAGDCTPGRSPGRTLPGLDENGQRRPLDPSEARVLLSMSAGNRYGNYAAASSRMTDHLDKTMSNTVDSLDGVREMATWDEDTAEDLALARRGFA